MSTHVMLSLLPKFALLVATMLFWLTAWTVSCTVLPRLLSLISVRQLHILITNELLFTAHGQVDAPVHFHEVKSKMDLSCPLWSGSILNRK